MHPMLHSTKTLVNRSLLQKEKNHSNSLKKMTLTQKLLNNQCHRTATTQPKRYKIKFVHTGALGTPLSTIGRQETEDAAVNFWQF